MTLKMPFSGMLGRVALVETDILEQYIGSLIRVEKISKLQPS
jgi:hypothetical protein